MTTPPADDSPTLPSLPVVPGPPAGWSVGQPLQDMPAGLTDVRYEDAVRLPAAPADPGPRTERRRALIGVGLVAAATVLVLLLAVVIGPRLGGSSDNADPGPVQPPASPAVPTPTAATTAATTHAATTLAATTPAATTPARTASAATPVTPAATGASTGHIASGKPKPSPTPTAPRARTTPPASPYGVPVKKISCSNGYIVQLASELTPRAFTKRVATLKAAGLVPPDALATDSTTSCKLFTNQRNTLILYAGPFEDRYAGCATRLAGPADAFIRGGRPATADEFSTCLCVAKVATLPNLRDGSHGAWVGELQRDLGHRSYRVAGLSNATWGIFTPGTKIAVQRYQAENGLRPTGVVDRNTWRKLHSELC